MLRGHKRPGSPETTTTQPKKIRVTFSGTTNEQSTHDEITDDQAILLTLPESSHGPSTELDSTSPTNTIDRVVHRVNDLTNQYQELATNQGEANYRLQTLQDGINQRLDTLGDMLLRNNLMANGRVSADNRNLTITNELHTTYGITPKNAMSNYLPHIDDSFLTKILNRDLKCKDLITLLPEEDRPKGRPAGAGLGAGFHINPAGVLSAIPGGSSMAAFEKDFPDFYTANQVLATYGAIRDMYDQDNLGIGGAILLYIKLLTRWIKNDCYEWCHVRAYFMAELAVDRPTSGYPLSK
jgi:hypothetical protein